MTKKSFELKGLLLVVASIIIISLIVIFVLPRPSEEIVCGDNICGLGESELNCPVDCGPQPVCGNELIEGSEQCDVGILNGVACIPGGNSTCQWCSDSCEIITEQGEICGNGICQDAENEQFCPADCVPLESVGELVLVCSDSDFTNYIRGFSGSDVELVDLLHDECFNVYSEYLGCPTNETHSTFRSGIEITGGTAAMAECRTLCEETSSGGSGHQLFSTWWENINGERLVQYSDAGILTVQDSCPTSLSIISADNVNSWRKI